MKDNSNAARRGPLRRDTTLGVVATATLANATPAQAFIADYNNSSKGCCAVNAITAKDGTEIYYKAWGRGPVVTLSMAFSQSLKHELTDKGGVRVQVVLLGATATDIWANSVLPVENLPKERVMQTDAMVDAALVGLDRGELMISPSLPDLAGEAFQKARKMLAQNLSRSEPAARYRIAVAAAE